MGLDPALGERESDLLGLVRDSRKRPASVPRSLGVETHWRRTVRRRAIPATVAPSWCGRWSWLRTRARLVAPTSRKPEMSAGRHWLPAQLRRDLDCCRPRLELLLERALGLPFGTELRLLSDPAGSSCGVSRGSEAPARGVATWLEARG